MEDYVAEEERRDTVRRRPCGKKRKRGTSAIKRAPLAPLNPIPPINHVTFVTSSSAGTGPNEVQLSLQNSVEDSPLDEDKENAPDSNLLSNFQGPEKRECEDETLKPLMEGSHFSPQPIRKRSPSPQKNPSLSGSPGDEAGNGGGSEKEEGGDPRSPGSPSKTQLVPFSARPYSGNSAARVPRPGSAAPTRNRWTPSSSRPKTAPSTGARLARQDESYNALANLQEMFTKVFNENQVLIMEKAEAKDALKEFLSTTEGHQGKQIVEQREQIKLMRNKLQNFEEESIRATQKAKRYKAKATEEEMFRRQAYCKMKFFRI